MLHAAYDAGLHDPPFQAIADMIALGFYFMLRPGEHTFAKGNTPFCLADVGLYIGRRKLNVTTATPHELGAATSVSLTFTTQKNGVKGEIITHGRSGDPWACPVRAAVRCVQYLQAQNLPLATPLCTYRDQGRLGHVTSAQVTAALRAGLILVDPDTINIQPSEIEARPLRAGGATALLCAGIDNDNDTIQLLGRWQSDAMLRYLHISASPVLYQYATQMFSGGSYTFTPGTTIPCRRIKTHPFPP